MIEKGLQPGETVVTDGHVRVVPGAPVEVKEAGNRRRREAVVNTALFIRRPVATTLVMLAILLAGAAGYRLLPVSDLPNVDFPTILVSANLPGASPETMAASVALAAREAVLDDRRPRLDELGERARDHPGHAAVRARARHRRRRAGRAGRDREVRVAAAAGDAGSALLPEGEPRRPADPLPQPALAHPQALRRRRVRADAHRAARVDGQRGGPGAGPRLAEVRGARAARPVGARHARPRHRRDRGGGRQGQREPADRHALGQRARRSRSRRTGSSPTPRATSRSSSRTRTACRCACATWAARSTPSRTTRSRAGSTASAGSRWPSSASRGRTRSRSSTR